MGKSKKALPRNDKAYLGLSAPNFVAATKGDFSGEVDITWEPVESAYIYIIQKCYNTSNSKWEQVDIIDRSSYTVSKLKSGKECKFRVAAVNSIGQGPWSKEVIKSAP